MDDRELLNEVSEVIEKAIEKNFDPTKFLIYTDPDEKHVIVQIIDGDYFAEYERYLEGDILEAIDC